ncbi:alpha-L-arabinofuranosidase C-terminal domain-containing protein [Nonomuraea sp. NPDC049784]|uniref:alpha-L-arabinofuranosidase C-terminal domain-containing protein n=1 Tax=Nonomuraea sp. NPDC049784 TaxID=3154361 RepID=UPI0033CE2B13
MDARSGHVGRSGRRVRTDGRRHRCPLDGGLGRLVELHDGGEGPQDRRRRRLPDHVRRARHRQLLLVEHRRLGRHSVGHREGCQRRQDADRLLGHHGRDRPRLPGQDPGERAQDHPWLDGQKINDFVDNAAVEPLYQVVSRDGDSVTLKVVNAQDTGVRSAVTLDGARVRPTATVTSLTGAPADVNSLTEPTKVKPVERKMTGFSNAFTYDFPADSVTFIRLTER